MSPIALHKKGASMDNIGTSVMPVSILVVDDEQNFLELLLKILSKRGYEVATASNGQEGIGLLKNQSFDLAIIDLRMGPIDGLSFLDEMKKRQPDTKAIMMTAYPTAETRMKSFQNGASAYFTKPMDLQALLQTIDGLV